MMNTFQIKVPGSSANLGPGFDSIGVGLDLYLTLHVTPQDQWEFIHSGPNVPSDTSFENHLIYQIATKVAARFNKTLKPCRVEMTSDLPLARGLGSSAAAIVAAIELANIVGHLNLSVQDKLNISSQIEGHPDNATASVLGGITISAINDGQVDTIHVQSIDASFIVIIPNYELKTSDARAVLPDAFDRGYAVKASANSNMLTAAIVQKDWILVGKYMEQDLYHEPFRAKLVPLFHEIKQEALKVGAYGTALSGAGPTMISIVPEHLTTNIVQHLKMKFPGYKILATKAVDHGILVKTEPAINNSVC